MICFSLISYDFFCIIHFRRFCWSIWQNRLSGYLFGQPIEETTQRNQHNCRLYWSTFMWIYSDDNSRIKIHVSLLPCQYKHFISTSMTTNEPIYRIHYITVYWKVNKHPFLLMQSETHTELFYNVSFVSMYCLF